MITPIVYLSGMAMNESVAATCCYRETASQTNVYWSVLNGGWIGQAYVTELQHKSAVSTSWRMLDYDVSNVDDGSVLLRSTIGDTTYYTVNGASLENVFLNDGIHKKLGSCNHNTASCAYLVGPSYYLKANQHCGSKSRHDTGGSGWSRPHDAQQWGS